MGWEHSKASSGPFKGLGQVTGALLGLTAPQKRRSAMTEDSEWIRIIQNENAYLKNQVRLLWENYELRSLLSQHCETSNPGRIAASHPAPGYPNARSPGQGAQPRGRDINPPEIPSHPSQLQEFGYSPRHMASKEAALSSSKAQAEATSKGIPSHSTLFQPAPRERIPTLLSSTSWTSRVEKQLADSIDLSRVNKGGSADLASPSGDKAQSHLYGMVHQLHGRVLGAPDLLSQPQPLYPGELTSSSPLSVSHKEGAHTQAAFPGCFKTPVPFSPGAAQRKSAPLVNSPRDVASEKASLGSEEVHKKRRVWFLETPQGEEPRKPHAYYLNELELNSKKNGRIVGEIAFQLDRRILAYVFPGVTRLYGYTVSNIPEKIKQASMKCLDGSLDEKKHRAMTQRYLSLTGRLEKMGYNRDVHPVFSELLINTYGILKQRPDLHASPLHSSPAELRKVVIEVVPSKFLSDTLLLLNCLCELSKDDGKPLFAW